MLLCYIILLSVILYNVIFCYVLFYIAYYAAKIILIKFHSWNHMSMVHSHQILLIQFETWVKMRKQITGLLKLKLVSVNYGYFALDLRILCFFCWVCFLCWRIIRSQLLCLKNTYLLRYCFKT